MSVEICFESLIKQQHRPTTFRNDLWMMLSGVDWIEWGLFGSNVSDCLSDEYKDLNYLKVSINNIQEKL